MENNNLKEKMEDVNFPQELDNIKTTTPIDPKKNRLFSKAIFMESFRSNKLTLLIISAFNAAIMIIIVMILSSLNLNANKNGMKNMFSGASMESTLKSGSISYYLGFDKTSQGIIYFTDNYESNVDGLKSSIDQVNSTQMSTVVNNAKRIYRSAYNNSSGDDSAKHYAAKNQTVNTAESILGLSNYGEKEKAISKYTVGYLLDKYHESRDTSKSQFTSTITFNDSYTEKDYNKELLIYSLPLGTSDYLIEILNVPENENPTLTQKVNAIFNDAFNRTYKENMSSYESATLATFDLLPEVVKYAGDSDISNNFDSILQRLKNAYNNTTTKSKYLNDISFRREIVGNAIVDVIIDNIGEFVYYSHLKDFTVIYQTSYYGYPIYYEETGLKDGDNKPILKESEAKEFMPDKFIKLSEGMEINSNLLHKMNKKIITGNDYTKEEITQARNDSKEDINMLKKALTEFTNNFLASDYFTKKGLSTTLNQYIMDAVSTKMISQAEEMLIDQYYEKYNKEIKSIYEIRANELSSMPGDELLSTIQGYIVSSISNYNMLYNKAINENRTERESSLSSMVHSSMGVVDQLPNNVSDALNEMTTLNTYGFFVGILAMSIACVLIPLVYNILLANSLVVDKVQTGSLAFVLSTPTNRSTFIFTEAIYLLFTQVVISLITYIGCLLSRLVGIGMGGTDLIESLSVRDLSLYSLGNFLTITSIACICFMTSCIFNKSKQSIGIGGGISIFFLVATILGLFGSEAMPSYIRIQAMSVFNYLSIISFFDSAAILNDNLAIFFVKLLGFIVIIIATLIVGIRRFIKKDLPL